MRLELSPRHAVCAIAVALGGTAGPAGTLFTMPNQAGGYVQLTDDTSKKCTELRERTGTFWFYVVGTDRSGGTALGCWSYSQDDDQVEVRWASGKTSLFEGTAFTRTPYGDRTLESSDSKPVKRNSGSNL